MKRIFSVLLCILLVLMSMTVAFAEPEPTEGTTPTETPVEAPATETPTDTTPVPEQEAPGDNQEATDTATETQQPTHKHSYDVPGSVTKQPTCSEEGAQNYICSPNTCGAVISKSIPKLEHTPGEWTIIKEATCKTKGEAKATCTVCGAQLTGESDYGEHQFEDSKVTKEATLYSTGIMEGVCKICGETMETEIPCGVTDLQTGMVFSAEVGVFAEGTSLRVQEIKNTDTKYEDLVTTLSSVCGQFIAYDISAKANGEAEEPNGVVTVTMVIPEGYGQHVSLVYIDEEGSMEDVPFELSEDGTQMVTELTHFSTYAICNLGSIAEDVEADNLMMTTSAHEKGGSILTGSIGKAVFWAVTVAVVAGVTLVCVKLSDRKNY